MRPPSARKYEASARPIACEPPGGDRPVLDVPGEGEDHSHRRGERPLQRQDRVRRTAGEQRARPLSAEAGAERAGRGQEAREPEAGELDRVARDAQRAEQIGEQLVRRAQERGEERLVGARIRSQLARGLVQRPAQQHGRLVVERVGDGGGRVDPAQPVLGRAADSGTTATGPPWGDSRSTRRARTRAA